MIARRRRLYAAFVDSWISASEPEMTAATKIGDEPLLAALA